jgi:magnesium chelatase family protein
VNAELPGTVLRRTFSPTPTAVASLDKALELGQISIRGADKIVRVAWTLTDLAGQQQPEPDQIHLAIGLWLGVRSE